MQPGAYMVQCGVCGRGAHAPDEAKMVDGVMTCIRHWHMLSRTERARQDAAIRPYFDLPKHPIFPFRDTNTYRLTEGAIFELLTSRPVGTQRGVPPYRYAKVTSGFSVFDSAAAVAYEVAYPASVSGWTCIYLYELINEGLRTTLIPRAKEKLRELADFIISKQAWEGNPNNTVASSSRAYGFVDTFGTGSALAEATWVCGLGLLYAYRVLGDGSYLAAAKRCAHAIRTLQRLDYHDPASATAYRGAVSYTATISNPKSFVEYFEVRDIAAIWFLKELQTTAGDITIGYSATYAGEWAASPATSISTAISDLRAFWTEGVAGIVGFSSATPRNYYTNVLSSNAWGYFSGTGTVSGLAYSIALWGLYKYEGYSEQVADVYEWLRAGASNEAFEPDDTDAPVDYDAQTGVYDARLCPAIILDSNAKVAEESQYHLGAGGLLAQVQADRDAGALIELKQNLAEPRPRSKAGAADGVYEYAVLRGVCGLNFQPGVTFDFNDDAGANYFFDCQSAAQAGLMYRYGERAF